MTTYLSCTECTRGQQLLSALSSLLEYAEPSPRSDKVFSARHAIARPLTAHLQALAINVEKAPYIGTELEQTAST